MPQRGSDPSKGAGVGMGGVPACFMQSLAKSNIHLCPNLHFRRGRKRLREPELQTRQGGLQIHCSGCISYKEGTLKGFPTLMHIVYRPLYSEHLACTAARQVLRSPFSSCVSARWKQLHVCDREGRTPVQRPDNTSHYYKSPFTFFGFKNILKLFPIAAGITRAVPCTILHRAGMV